jgi:hypothetical protein
MSSYLADLSPATEYAVHLQWTSALEPRQLTKKLPYVSLLDVIAANSATPEGQELRRRYGFIPYSSPLYWWESCSYDGHAICEYIGKTVDMTLQRRFAAHAKLVQLLAKYVNEPMTRVMFRMCSRLDIVFGGHRLAVEHLPPDQAISVIADVEAHLIFEHQPPFNTRHRVKRKKPWKPFTVWNMPPLELPSG